MGLSLEEPLVAELRRNGFDRRDAPVIVQSFEVGTLQELDELTDVRLGQLVGSSGAPHDLVTDGDPRTCSDLVTRQGLREVATYADGIGAENKVLIPRDDDGTLTAPNPVIREAHRAGLDVHAGTFRGENQFLAASSAPRPTGTGPATRWVRSRCSLMPVWTDVSDNPDLADVAVS